MIPTSIIDGTNKPITHHGGHVIWLITLKLLTKNKDPYLSLNYPFCLVYDSLSDLKNNFHFLFHKNYFYRQSNPVIFFNSELTDEKNDSTLQFLHDQGYFNPLLIWNSKGEWSSEDLLVNNSEFSFEEYLKNYIEDKLIFLSSLEQYHNLKAAFDLYLNKNPELRPAVKQIIKLQHRNKKLTEDLRWTKGQLNNHKTYLMVLKELIKKGSDLGVGTPSNRFISLLKRIGPIRKTGKYVYKIIRSI